MEIPIPKEDLNIPVRLCCGQRHLDPICPDGKVMCCLCFKRVSQDDLKILPNGNKEDVCKSCSDIENDLMPSKEELDK